MCINNKITREEFFGDSIVVWCATILLVKLFSAFTSRKETSETTCEIPSSSRRCFRIGTGILQAEIIYKFIYYLCYKADQEKKQTAEREGYHADPEKKRSAKRQRYHADPEKKRSAKRQRYHADPEKKRSAKRQRYHADPEKKRSAERKRYWEGPECARLAKRVRYGKAKRTLQNQRGHRKRTTDKVIQRYVNVDVVTCTVSQILSRVCI